MPLPPSVPAVSPQSGSPGDRLAALLQTAVDEQVAEQRQLSQVLADVRAALSERRGERDGSTLQDLHDGLAGLRTDLRVVPETVAPAIAQAVGSGLTDVGRTLERLEDAQAARGRDLAALHEDLAALRTGMERLTASQEVLAAAPAVQSGPSPTEIANIVREGVRDATRDFVRDYLRQAVLDIVTVSTRDTERRITDHVDEAVLALAQALLRRSPGLPAEPSGVVAAQATGEPGPASPFTPWTDPEVGVVSRDGVASKPEPPAADTEPAESELKPTSVPLPPTVPLAPPETATARHAARPPVRARKFGGLFGRR